MQPGKPGKLEEKLKPLGLNNTLLILTKESADIKSEEERQTLEREAILPTLAQIQHQRQTSNQLQILQRIIKIFANREPALSANDLRELEHELNVPMIDCYELPEVKYSSVVGASPYITPLMYAAMHQSVAYVRALLESGASIHLEDKAGRTALHHAVQTKNNPTLPLLLKAKAPINTMDKQGLTPLMKAVKNNDIETLLLLLEEGADVNLADFEFNTALSIAIEQNFLQVCKILLRNGARVTSKNVAFALTRNRDNTYTHTTSKIEDKQHGVRLQIAAQLLSSDFQLERPDVLFKFLQTLNCTDAQAQSALCFCKAEALFRKGEKPQAEGDQMLKFYETACTDPFIPAAARRLAQLAIAQDEPLQAIAYLMEATLGRKQPTLLPFLLEKLSEEQKNVTGEYKEANAFAQETVDEWDTDPLAWSLLFDLAYKIERQVRPDEKSTPSSDQNSIPITAETLVDMTTVAQVGNPVEVKIEAKTVVAETKKEDPQISSVFFAMPPRVQELIHQLLFQIPVPILKNLNDLNSDACDYVITLIRDNLLGFSDPTHAGRLILQAARRCYEIMPDSSKDKLNKIGPLLGKIEQAFPDVVSVVSSKPKAETKANPSTALSLEMDLDLAEAPAVHKKTSDSKLSQGEVKTQTAKPKHNFSNKDKDKLLSDALQLLLKLLIDVEKKQLWKDIINKIPSIHKNDAEKLSEIKSFDEMHEVFKENAFLSNFRLIPQKERAQLIKHVLFAKFKELYLAADQTVDSSEIECFTISDCIVKLSQLAPSTKESFVQKIKTTYLSYYKDAISPDVLGHPYKPTNPAASVSQASANPNAWATALVQGLVDNAIDESDQQTWSEVQSLFRDRIRTDLVPHILATEPKDLQTFVRLIEPVDAADNSQEAGDSFDNGNNELPPGLMSNDFPSNALTKVIFLLLKTTLIEGAENSQQQEALITPLLPAVYFQEKPLGILAVAIRVMSPGRRLELQAQLVDVPNVDCKDDRGQTPLMYAASNCNLGAARALVKAKAHIHEKDKDKYSVLSFALQQADNPVAEFLLSIGADRNDIDPKGYSALMKAVINQDLKLIKLLLDKNANPNYKDNNLCTALHYAAEQGQIETIQLLLTYKADLNVTNKDGDTPLMLAARKGHTDAARLLIDNKANVHPVNAHNQTALEIATQKGFLEIIKLLLFAKANPNRPGINIVQLIFNNYTEEKFDAKDFVAQCKNVYHRISLLAFLLAFHVEIQQAPKLFEVIKQGRPPQVDQEENLWHFCMAELQCQTAADAKLDEHIPVEVTNNRRLQQITSHYEESFPFHYKERRLCEFLMQRQAYKEAFDHWQSAKSNSDPLAWHTLIRLGYQLNINASKEHEGLRLRVETYFADLTLQEISDWPQELTQKEWDYLAETLYAQSQSGHQPNIKIFLYAAKKSYGYLPYTDKDKLASLLNIWKNGIPRDKFKDAIFVIVELLTENKLSVLWDNLHKLHSSDQQESKRSLPPSQAFSQISKDKRLEAFQGKFALLNQAMQSSFIAKCMFAIFVIKAIEHDKVFDHPQQTNLLFSALLNINNLPDPDQLLPLMILFPLSRKEEFRLKIQAWINQFKTNLKSEEVLRNPEFSDYLRILKPVIKADITEQKEEKNKANTIAAAPAKSVAFEDLLLDLFPRLGIDLNFIQDTEGNNLIIRAVRNDNAVRLKQVLALKIDVNWRNNEDQTALLIAAFNQKGNLVKLLLQAKANPDFGTKKLSPLCAAVIQKDRVVMQILLEHKANPNWQNVDQCTALFYAAREGDLEAVQLLIQFKANIEAVDKVKATPLIYAARHKQPKVLEFLLKEGSANLKHTTPWTAIQWLFSQQLPNGKGGCYSQKIEIFDKKKFAESLAESKDQDALFECAAILLSYNSPIPECKKLVEVLETCKKPDSKFWSYSMGRCLQHQYMDKPPVKADEKLLAPIEQYYKAAGNYPPAIRGLGLVEYQRGKYQEAVALYHAAHVLGDTMVFECMVQLALTLITRLKLKPTEPKWGRKPKNIEPALLVNLEQTLASMSIKQLRLCQLPHEGWDYLGTLFQKKGLAELATEEKSEHKTDSVFFSNYTRVNRMHYVHLVRYTVEQQEKLNKYSNLEQKDFCYKTHNYFYFQRAEAASIYDRPVLDGVYPNPSKLEQDKQPIGQLIAEYCLGEPATAEELEKIAFRPQ